MKKTLLVISLLSLSGLAHAQWVTNSEDDVFSGGEKATMVAMINNDVEQAVAFDCTQDSLTLAYIEKSPELGKVKIPVQMVMKVDSGELIKFTGETGVRNTEYSQSLTTDKDAIIKVLKGAVSAKNKMLIGLSVPEVDVKQSFSLDVVGSSAAVNKFAKSCDIDLK